MAAIDVPFENAMSATRVHRFVMPVFRTLATYLENAIEGRSAINHRIQPAKRESAISKKDATNEALSGDRNRNKAE